MIQDPSLKSKNVIARISRVFVEEEKSGQCETEDWNFLFGSSH
jgi:hypothetical protein